MTENLFIIITKGSVNCSAFQTAIHHYFALKLIVLLTSPTTYLVLISSKCKKQFVLKGFLILLTNLQQLVSLLAKSSNLEFMKF